MIRGRCPTCGRAFEAESLADWPSFPFCSPRCRLVDLGRWADGSYAIPAGPPKDRDEPDDDRPDAEADPGDD
ncbi:MAG: DNA gyrase inhibitor YacG [Isosphaeraceae bacterium]